MDRKRSHDLVSDEDNDLALALMISEIEHEESICKRSRTDNESLSSSLINLTNDTILIIDNGRNFDVPLSNGTTVNISRNKNNSSSIECKESNYLSDEKYLITLETWLCNECGTRNDRSLDVCLQCSEPQSYGWSCSRCTFDNQATDEKCIMCGLFRHTHNHSSSSSTSLRVCALPGCALPATYHGFCDKRHWIKASNKNILPPSEPGVDRVLLGSTGSFAVHLLMKTHPRHASVKKQFLDGWETAEQPRVERVFWINIAPSVREAYDYKKAQIGNIRRRFHGTSQHVDCSFGIDINRAPCDRKGCAVCSICCSSFDKSKAGSSGGTRLQLRYGNGIYFSHVSSKSHDYANECEKIRRSGDGKLRRWRCMFLCSVAVGKEYTTQRGTLPVDLCPPVDYHSVVGLRGKDLNYDEVVVYSQDQAVPSYLIVYSLQK